MDTIGFIGCGSMAKAMIGGLVSSGYVSPGNVYASNPSPGNLDEMREAYGIATTHDNLEVARKGSILFLSVTPNKYDSVIAEIRDSIREEAIIIMIAAGQTLEQNEQRFGRPVKLARSMPNTPMLVGEGMAAVSVNERISEGEKQLIKEIFQCFGKVEFVEEHLMDVVSGVSGASPAYAYMFIEALADGAVLQGMPRKQAYAFASQAVLGAAKMVLETGKHPGALKDEVCSAGGATIEAVASLEENGLRSAVIKAVQACVKKSQSMK
ncbi:pyrroline-5-carboxylate reductase [Mesobacillus campisalis]|uniref:Pyrroline-5-carboxylate reductase n=1 Tax=Mesobacillus campisalis TaxID=1408103 RepID=A0A0M2STR2_9BACI|nr:pyrroline-5-carboxylate reductase [Mesobacillus campisalis]KKK36362.1 pyrroline-5-carboxylate reductase [Mesobacillus campisalis]